MVLSLQAVIPNTCFWVFFINDLCSVDILNKNIKLLFLFPYTEFRKKRKKAGIQLSTIYHATMVQQYTIGYSRNALCALNLISNFYYNSYIKYQVIHSLKSSWKECQKNGKGYLEIRKMKIKYTKYLIWFWYWDYEWQKKKEKGK